MQGVKKFCCTLKSRDHDLGQRMSAVKVSLRLDYGINRMVITITQQRKKYARLAIFRVLMVSVFNFVITQV